MIYSVGWDEIRSPHWVFSGYIDNFAGSVSRNILGCAAISSQGLNFLKKKLLIALVDYHLYGVGGLFFFNHAFGGRYKGYHLLKFRKMVIFAKFTKRVSLCAYFSIRKINFMKH